MVFFICRANLFPLVSFVCASLWSEVFAEKTFFLGSRQQHMSADGLRAGRADLLHDLEQIAGREHRVATEGRVERLEDAIQPIFAAMPKNEHDRLDSAGVRYLLHRHFVQRHGWIVKGLDNGGSSWNSSSPVAVFEGHADEHRDVFEARLAENGFSLHQVAVFAATLEALVHDENRARLDTAYRVTGFENTTRELQSSEVDLVIRAFMLMFVQATNLTSVTVADFERMSSDALELYPTWPDTEQFAYGVRRVVLESVPEEEHQSWSTTLKVVEAIGERYGRWQDKECRDLKAMLLQMEDQGTGRVRLDKFYGSAFTDQNWQFLESIPYLRQLGALDESDPQQMKVIIPNYVNSPANCVASAGFYDVCCIDECEALMGKLETQIRAADATPEQIAKIVASLPSATVDAPRNLGVNLRKRLDDIASQHNGRVPLHGRLFAQWMHHAFPRECTYPHVSGTTRRLTQEDWIQQSSEPLVASAAEIEQLLAETKGADVQIAGYEPSMPWSPEEELFVCRPSLQVTEPKRDMFASCSFSLMSVLAAFFLAVARHNYAKPHFTPNLPVQKYFV
jgi:hypothetical protein